VKVQHSMSKSLSVGNLKVNFPRDIKIMDNGGGQVPLKKKKDPSFGNENTPRKRSFFKRYFYAQCKVHPCKIVLKDVKLS